MSPPACRRNRPVLNIRQLNVRFGGLRVLNDATFTVRENAITGLIGPNGAGKTTLFNCITGLLPAARGSVEFHGDPILGWRPDRIARAGLVRTFQLARGFPRMSVFEHLMLYGKHQPGESLLAACLGSADARGREAALREQAFQVARRLKLDHVLDHLVVDISGGQKKLLEIGRALMAEPRMLLLDEPMAGVNPTLAREIAEQLARLREDGLTVLLIEHDLELVRLLCDDVVVMAEGAFLTRGGYDDVIANPAVQDAYLGRRHAARAAQ
ncbi:ABC transporter ATP-binding protein [Bordetella genomosp. 9]|uniref:ABC transporter ATP-binding protein n=1 Tax=Bordetella genomosp. 9 TaxID=1416803 RepID=A0A261R9H2_9BORD|nr:ABC transporter ATP-binding protein [Bordetella genomosp. 9]